MFLFSFGVTACKTVSASQLAPAVFDVPKEKSIV
jgi:hypothetical protein